MTAYTLPDNLQALTGSQLCSWLVDALTPHVGNQAYICWLKNAGQDVIGLFPIWCISHHMALIKDSKVARRQFDTLPKYLAQDIQATPEDVLSDYLFEREDSLLQHEGSLFEHEGSNSSQDTTQANAHGTAANPSNTKAQYHNGLMGFVGYDYAAYRTAGIQTELPDLRPSLFFGHYDIVIKCVQAGWQLEHIVTAQIANKNRPNSPNTSEACFKWLKGVIEGASKSNAQQPNQDTELHHFSYHWNKPLYKQAFSKVQDYLRAGDCYQVNLAQSLHANQTGAAHKLLAKLDANTNAPYAGYLQVGDFDLICCSPELFLSFQKQDDTSIRDSDSTTTGGDTLNTTPLNTTPPNTIKVVTKPIKGTLPRLKDTKADAKQADLLANSEKNQAENLMIVDLLRNDLSKYAKAGTVQVPKLFEIESFTQVHHMVSTIEAELHSEANPFDVLMSALPGGSITGAPKIRAIEIIAELEKQARGAYCGSLGYLNFDGTGEFNILIRSLEFWQGKMQLWAGGGITIASTADDEYQECMDKISGIVEVLEAFTSQKN